jgi:hypothetical protein
MHLPGLLYLAALGAIANANTTFIHGLVLIVLFNVVMLAPIELPLLGSIVAPQATERTVERANSFCKRHTREGLLGLSLLAGGYLIVSGIVGLLRESAFCPGNRPRLAKKADWGFAFSASAAGPDRVAQRRVRECARRPPPTRSGLHEGQ